MTIVCGVDASAGAREALRVSARLGRRLGARVLAVHVVDGVAGSRGEEDVPLDVVEGGRRIVDRALADVGVQWADVRVEVGHPAARLAEVIDEERAELVVIGSERHGRRWRPTLRARLATELGERTSVPVLVAAPAPLPARRSAGDRRARAS